MTLATFATATVALGAVSSFSPSSGTVAPGGSTSASFTITPPPLSTSCVTASIAPSSFQLSVAFDGLGLGALPANCALGATEVEMTVTAGANAAPGQYRVVLTEIALLGGALISTREWPFEVLAPPTTSSSTTSTSPTTTSTSATTSTSSATPTTTRPTTTTGPTTPGATTDTTEPGLPAENDDPANGNDDDPASGAPAAPDSSTTSSSPSPSSDGGGDDGDQGIAAPASHDPAGGPPGDGGGSTADSDFLSKISLSESLRNHIGEALPVSVAEAVLSPLVIAEFLFRSVLGSALGYAVPLLLAAVFGWWMVIRMRREIDDDELGLQSDV